MTRDWTLFEFCYTYKVGSGDVMVYHVYFAVFCGCFGCQTVFCPTRILPLAVCAENQT
jgi:hypothetical protein